MCSKHDDMSVFKIPGQFDRLTDRKKPQFDRLTDRKKPQFDRLTDRKKPGPLSLPKGAPSRFCHPRVCGDPFLFCIIAFKPTHCAGWVYLLHSHHSKTTVPWNAVHGLINKHQPKSNAVFYFRVFASAYFRVFPCSSVANASIFSAHIQIKKTSLEGWARLA